MRYRRTIFTIIEYLCRLDEQRRYINKMASDSLKTAKNSIAAKKEIDKKKPQLFFKFIISLISDALSLQHVRKLKNEQLWNVSNEKNKKFMILSIC